MSADERPAALDGEPLTKFAARLIRQDILNGVHPAGERITQDALARKYGTSRLPVREALRELEAEGLVTIVPDVGARVATLDPQDLVEAYLMREALEPLAVARAAELRTEEQLAKMEEALDHSEACSPSDTGAYLNWDRVFHQLTFAASPLPRISRVIDGLWSTTYRHPQTFMLIAARREIGHLEHRLMLDAFQRRAGQDASDLQRVHVRRSRVLLDEVVLPATAPRPERHAPPRGVRRQ